MENSTTPSTKSKAPVVIGVVLALVILGALAAWALGGNKEAEVGQQQPGGAATTTSSTVPVDARTYRDGTYRADGAYVSPAGAESVSISVTLVNDVITDATFTGNATNPTSKQLQARFAAAFRQQVVGTSIDAVSLTVVNGSSLAPKGFMDALAKVKAEARI